MRECTFHGLCGSVPMSLLAMVDSASEQTDPFVQAGTGGFLLRQFCVFERLLRLRHKCIRVSLLSLCDRRLGVRHDFCQILTPAMS